MTKFDVATWLAEGRARLDRARGGLLADADLDGSLASLDRALEAVAAAATGRPPGAVPDPNQVPRWALAGADQITRVLDDAGLQALDALAHYVGEVLRAALAGQGAVWSAGSQSNAGRLVIRDARGAETDPLFLSFHALHHRRAGDNPAKGSLTAATEAVLTRSRRSEEDRQREALSSLTPDRVLVVRHTASGLRRRRRPLDRAALEAALTSWTGRPAILGADVSCWLGYRHEGLPGTVVFTTRPVAGDAGVVEGLVVTVLGGGDEPRSRSHTDALEDLLRQVRGLAADLGAEVEDTTGGGTTPL